MTTPDLTGHRIAHLEPCMATYGQEHVTSTEISWLISELRKARKHNALMMDYYECKMSDKERFSLIEEEMLKLREQVRAAEIRAGILDGTFCDDEQASGNGPCGICQKCLQNTASKLREQVRIARDFIDGCEIGDHGQRWLRNDAKEARKKMEAVR